MIVCPLPNLDDTVRGMRTSQDVTCWSVKALPDERRKEEYRDWYQAGAGLLQIEEESSREDIEKEVD